MASQLDSQVTERLGENILVAELMQAGLEVAEPIRDRGIDLLVYRDRKRFRALPVQLKVATVESLGIYRKYEKIPDLLIVHVWRVLEPQRVIYALNYKDALKVCEAMGYTKTASWTEKDGYSTRHISAKLRDLLEPHRIKSPDEWRHLLDRVTERHETSSTTALS
jgi:hypothetical protein